MAEVVVQLRETPRRFRAVFPLESVGFIDHPACSEVAVPGKLELCLRLASTAETARDRLDGEEYRTPFPNVIFKLPEMLHRFAVERPREVVFFKYPPELSQAMQAAGLFCRPFCREIPLTSELGRILREVRELLPRSQELGVADRLDLLALRVFEACLPVPEPPPSPGADAGLRRIASWFQLHYHREIDLDRLLAENGFSRRNFFRAWQRAFRTSPAQYLQQLKYAEARRLLEESSLPVHEIAARLGFAGANYFSGFFKRHAQITPLEYRKNLNRTELPGFAAEPARCGPVNPPFPTAPEEDRRSLSPVQ